MIQIIILKAKTFVKSSHINFRMAPNQLEFSSSKCIFVPNFMRCSHLDQLGQNQAVNLWSGKPEIKTKGSKANPKNDSKIVKKLAFQDKH